MVGQETKFLDFILLVIYIIYQIGVIIRDATVKNYSLLYICICIYVCVCMASGGCDLLFFALLVSFNECVFDWERERERERIWQLDYVDD